MSDQFYLHRRGLCIDAQTHPQYRDFPAEVRTALLEMPASKGVQGPGEIMMWLGVALRFELDYLVVAVDHRLPAQFPQVLGEVVNEGIVIVYYQYHFQACLPH